MKKITLPAGFTDIMPEEGIKWGFIEKTAKSVFDRYGFSEIRTPFLEYTDLFIRGVGENTDIVEKEMYTFGDTGDSVTLRPEGTAPVVRSYIENGFDKFDSFQKFFYLGPMFRHEKPQKGRKRQFFQAGVEILGSDLPSADAEVLVVGVRLLQSLRVRNFILKINTTGCRECKGTIRGILKDELKEKLDSLCENCRRRYDTNIFRVLDCKNETCRNEFTSLPDILASVCPSCREHHEMVKRHLFSMKIEFEEDPFLVRGLDYYTRTVFEFTHTGLGAQDTILAGGRYDNLVEEMGGRPRGAVGFASGLDRIAEVMKDPDREELREGIYLITVGEQAYSQGFRLVQEMRDNGIKADLDFEGRSLKSQMKLADRRKFRVAAILGEDELKDEKILFRDLREGTQVEMPLEGFIGRISQVLKEVDEDLKREIQDEQVR